MLVNATRRRAIPLCKVRQRYPASTSHARILFTNSHTSLNTCNINDPLTINTLPFSSQCFSFIQHRQQLIPHLSPRQFNVFSFIHNDEYFLTHVTIRCNTWNIWAQHGVASSPADQPTKTSPVDFPFTNTLAQFSMDKLSNFHPFTIRSLLAQWSNGHWVFSSTLFSLTLLILEDIILYWTLYPFPFLE